MMLFFPHAELYQCALQKFTRPQYNDRKRKKDYVNSSHDPLLVTCISRQDGAQKAVSEY